MKIYGNIKKEKIKRKIEGNKLIWLEEQNCSIQLQRLEAEDKHVRSA